MGAFGNIISKEFILTDFKLHFILRFDENSNLEMNIGRETVIRLLFLFVLPANFVMVYFFLVKSLVLN